MQILINSHIGKTMTMLVEGSETIQQIKERINEKQGVYLADQYILHRGRVLEDDKEVDDYEILEMDTLQVRSRVRGGNGEGAPSDAPEPTVSANNTTSPLVTTNSTKKSKCAAPSCNDKVAKIIGDCRYCQGKFCAKHRLPEAHMCSNLQSCKKESHEKNTNKLLGEKCVANKV